MVRVEGGRPRLSTLVFFLNEIFPFLCEGFQIVEIWSELLVDDRVRRVDEVALRVPSED